MSRNFELLRQIGKEQEVLETRRLAVKPMNGNGRGLNLEAVTTEEVKKLIHRVFLSSNAGAGPKMVVFSGVEHGNGCSLTCARTGETLAVMGAGSVCLVDANLRSPSLDGYFGVDNLLGLSDAVLHSGPILDYAQRLSQTNLSLVPVGSRAAEVESILASDRLGARMAELRTEFDYVLIDASPVVSYADAIALGQMADGVIMVLGANSTRRETALKAKDSLDAANVRLLGAVLNRRTFPIPEGLYRRL